MLLKRPILLGCLGVLASLDLSAEPPPIAPLSAPVQVAVSSACFSHGPATSMRLGSRLLARHLSATLNRPVELQLCESEDFLLGVLSRGGAQVVMLTGESLVKGRRRAIPLEPLMMSDGRSRAGCPWVLLGRDGQTWTTVGRGHIIVSDAGQGALPELWLQHRWPTGAGQAAGGPAFRITSETRPEIAVLRTFLGKADACVVPESTFVAACSDNPEVASRLLPLATSPPLPGSIVTLCPGTGPEAPALRKAVIALAQSVHGRTLATLLQSDGWGPIDDAVLAGLEKFVPTAPAGAPATPVERPLSVSPPPRPGPPSLRRR